jgi:nucleotide-binding universal stress UspA family protein
MVYVDADGTPEQRVRLSASLADKFSATLIGISAAAFRPPMMVEGIPFRSPMLVQAVHSPMTVGGAAIEEATESVVKETNTKLASKEKWFRNIVGADHRKLEWRSVLDYPAEALAREARSADLVVIGRMAGPGDAYSSLDPGGAILRIGRPTLVVPEGVSSLIAEHVVIGWKDTREARRAVQDAIPFLHEATRVTIAEICEHGEERAALGHIDDVARYLTRHGINGGPKVMLQKEGSGAAQLIRLAQDEGADLLVAGAYGHSRLGELVFGGMTRELLATSPICCLMSH